MTLEICLDTPHHGASPNLSATQTPVYRTQIPDAHVPVRPGRLLRAPWWLFISLRVNVTILAIVRNTQRLEYSIPIL